MVKKRRTFSVTAMLLGLLTQPAFPTTVAPMSFDQLVQQAEVVFIGDVRVRAKNACGAGAVSNEVVLVVS